MVSDDNFVTDGMPSYIMMQERKTGDLKFINGKLYQKVLVTRYVDTLFVKVEEWKEVEGQ
jgi:hypothetical protein